MFGPHIIAKPHRNVYLRIFNKANYDDHLKIITIQLGVDSKIVRTFIKTSFVKLFPSLTLICEMPGNKNLVLPINEGYNAR